MPRHATNPQADAERAGQEFDEILRASEQRAEEKRETRTYPYDLEDGE